MQHTGKRDDEMYEAADYVMVWPGDYWQDVLPTYALARIKRQ